MHLLQNSTSLCKCAKRTMNGCTSTAVVRHFRPRYFLLLMGFHIIIMSRKLPRGKMGHRVDVHNHDMITLHGALASVCSETFEQRIQPQTEHRRVRAVKLALRCTESYRSSYFCATTKPEFAGNRPLMHFATDKSGSQK